MSIATLIIAGAIIAVIVTRRFNPVVGSGLGMALTIGIAVWGVMTFQEGNAVALGPFELTQTAFLGIVGAWFALEAYGLYQALRRKQLPDQ